MLIFVSLPLLLLFFFFPPLAVFAIPSLSLRYLVGVALPIPFVSAPPLAGQLAVAAVPPLRVRLFGVALLIPFLSVLPLAGRIAVAGMLVGDSQIALQDPC